MCVCVCVSDVPMLSEVVQSVVTGSSVIPLSVEMLSDSDDDDDGHRPITAHLNSSLSSAPPATSATDGSTSKLLLLKMASEFVEAAAAAAAHQPATPCMMIFTACVARMYRSCLVFVCVCLGAKN